MDLAGCDDVRSGLLRDALAGRVADTLAFAAQRGIDHNVVVGAAQSLAAHEMLVLEPQSQEILVLKPEALAFLEHGSPEYRFYSTVSPGGSTEEQIRDSLGEALYTIGRNVCMRNKWLAYDKGSKLFRRTEVDARDLLALTLRDVHEGRVLSDTALAELKRRQLVDVSTLTFFKLSKGPKSARELAKQATNLTKAMLADSSWKTAELKPFNLKSLGTAVGGGHLHLLLKMRAEYRKILLEMGFNEMPSNRWVESSFWNFDALFQPQSHPARDSHDTFFLKPTTPCFGVPKRYFERVKAMHESGGSGSLGHRYAWSESEACRHILRTHTTAVSARMLYEVANQPGGFTPVKLFSIDRVFRNETQDATHLAEFHQIEGVVADFGLGLGDLIGIITEFFSRVGIHDVVLKSAYNPYTEPSMERWFLHALRGCGCASGQPLINLSTAMQEIFSKHPVLGLKEIGNSGVFRPEMLRPMGFPEGVRVIAWGLSLERPTMITHGVNNIRDLFGHKVKLSLSRNAPVVRLGKPKAV